MNADIDSHTDGAVAAPTARIGQLTFASFDAPERGGAGGGWQVKQTVGDITVSEDALMREWVTTRFETPQPVPPFPSRSQIEARPRRLMYGRTTSGAVGYWHSVPAGPDASGRPGNVFTHVVLDREPSTPSDDRRPICSWKSEDWLVPFGAQEVAAAEIRSAETPPVGRVVDRAGVIAFLLDPGTWRIGVLRVLLDAVAAALAGGPKVVLAARDPDVAAMWVGAVSFLMPPTVARAFGWSTFDRHYSVEESHARGIHLVAVPLEDAEEIAAVVERTGCVFLSEQGEDIELGELGVEPHRTGLGNTVEVTPWSVLAEAILLDDDTALRALERQDVVAREIDDYDARPAWALAVVVNELGLEDGLAAAGQVLADPALPAIGAAAAWEALHRALDSEGTPPDREWYVFLRSAMRDLGWLRECPREFPGAFARAEGWATASLCREVDGVVADLLRRSRVALPGTPDHEVVAVDLVRLLELSTHAGIVGNNEEAVYEILERTVEPILFDSLLGPAFVRRVGPLRNPRCAEIIQRVVSTSSHVRQRPMGRRLGLDPLAWVLRNTIMRPDLDALERDAELIGSPGYLLLAEVVMQAFELGDPLRHKVGAEDVPATVWRALFEASEGDWPVSDISPLFSRGLVLPADLFRVVRVFPGALPNRFLAPALLGSGPDDAVDEAGTRIADQAWSGRWSPAARVAPLDPGRDETVAAWSIVRSARFWDSPTAVDLQHFLGRWFPMAIESFAREPGAAVAENVAGRLVVACLAAAAYPPIVGRPVPELTDSRRREIQGLVATSRIALSRTLADLTTAGALDAHWFVAAAVVADPSAPSTEASGRLRARFDQVYRGAFDDLLPLVADTVDVLLRRPGALIHSERSVMDALWSEFNRWDLPAPGRVCEDLRDSVRSWVAARQIPAIGVDARAVWPAASMTTTHDRLPDRERK